jgi:hypothetical protein
MLFFSLDRKEPKDQDCQKKSGNSAAPSLPALKFILVRDETPEHSIGTFK